MIAISKEQSDNLRRRFSLLYGVENAGRMMERFQMLLGRYNIGTVRPDPGELWTEKDTVLISYADSIQTEGELPLDTLRKFLCQHAKSAIRCVHLLPFCPWTSDDGFSVVDYRQVEPSYGDWTSVEKIGQEFNLMFDLVLNHCSRKSQWFRDFVMGVSPGKNYFLPTDPEAVLTDVVRPRATPLLTKTATREGNAWVWATFSSDQVDLNWQDPDLLFEFLDILFLYLSKGCRILRLDAVAFLWKEIGTDCLHLPETHQVVKLFRDVLEIVSPRTVLLTETNVPHEENISYFGQEDEAHMVYNFSLPPLLLHGLLRGDATLLSEWAKSLPALPANETFLNFTASHDGIGVRPLQGLIDEKELKWLIDEVKDRQGQVSVRSLPDGSEAPYEMNISYIDALAIEGDVQLSIRRFLCSQAVMLSLPGVPAIYIHSLLGTPNDIEGFEKLGYNRALNRKKWQLDDLEQELSSGGKQEEVFQRYLGILRRRADCPAFHPNAAIRFVEFANNETHLFGFVRGEPGSDEEIACLFNFSDQACEIDLANLHPNFSTGEPLLKDLLHGTQTQINADRKFELVPYAAHWFRL